jgi:hypothetical protein
LSTYEFIIALFCRVDDTLTHTTTPQTKHPQAKLWPSELATLGILRALKGVSFRAFHRGLVRNYADLFPNLPDRTRLLRLLRRHCSLADAFLHKATKHGFVDSFGIEMIHPKREGRSQQQHGRKGLSNHRWIVGVKLCPLLTAKGSIIDWDFDTANVHDSQFLYLVERNKGTRFQADSNFRRCAKRGGVPGNLMICERGQNNERMVIETVFSLWQGTLHLKKTTTRKEAHLEALLAFAVAAYNLVVNWTGKTKLQTTFFSL